MLGPLAWVLLAEAAAYTGAVAGYAPAPSVEPAPSNPTTFGRRIVTYTYITLQRIVLLCAAYPSSAHKPQQRTTSAFKGLQQSV